MALVQCPECGKLVSQQASNCPHCGYRPTDKKSNGCVNVFAIIFLIIVAIMIIDSFQGNNKPSTRIDTRSKMWYEGGTLQKATIADWRIATEANKLATCSDFVAKIRKDKGIAFDEYEIKRESYDLMRCIDAAIVDVDVDTWKVSEMAATCLVLLK